MQEAKQAGGDAMRSKQRCERSKTPKASKSFAGLHAKQARRRATQSRRRAILRLAAQAMKQGLRSKKARSEAPDSMLFIASSPACLALFLLRTPSACLPSVAIALFLLRCVCFASVAFFALLRLRR
jgi:hypothetical protein